MTELKEVVLKYELEFPDLPPSWNKINRQGQGRFYKCQEYFSFLDMCWNQIDVLPDDFMCYSYISKIDIHCPEKVIYSKPKTKADANTPPYKRWDITNIAKVIEDVFIYRFNDFFLERGKNGNVIKLVKGKTTRIDDCQCVSSTVTKKVWEKNHVKIVVELLINVKR